MRSFTLFFAVVCILAFSTSAFAQCDNTCQREPLKKVVVAPLKVLGVIVEVRPARTAVKGVAKGVVKIIKAKPARTVVKGTAKGVAKVFRAKLARKAVRRVGKVIVNRPRLRCCCCY